MTPVVVDASALGEYLLRTDLGLQIGTIIEAPDTHLNVPALCDVEVCSALTSILRAGAIDRVRAEEALAVYVDLPLVRHGHVHLAQRMLELGEAFSVRDAAYLALCEHLGATLVTGDGRLTRAVRRLLALSVVGVGA